MTWRFSLPGQPLSWNRAYRIGYQYGKRGRYMTLIKTAEAERFQDEAVLIIRSAKPSGWEPKGQVRIHYWLYLARAIDSDNVLKLINDAIQTATGIDDKYYLPTVEEKTKGWGKKARVEVVVEDLASHSAGRPGSTATLNRSSSSSAT